MALPSYAFVILAAGGSSRMGSPKQLLPYRGRPLLRHAAETALETVCRPVITVLGAQPETVGAALDGLPVERVVNPLWRQGMGTSIRAGVELAQTYGVDGVILGLADQPLVGPTLLNRLVLEHRKTGRPIVASSYAGTAGVPVFFAREMFGALLALEPEQGCKGLILGHPAGSVLLPCPEAEADIDTPEEYRRLALQR